MPVRAIREFEVRHLESWPHHWITLLVGVYTRYIQGIGWHGQACTWSKKPEIKALKVGFFSVTTFQYTLSRISSLRASLLCCLYIEQITRNISIKSTSFFQSLPFSTHLPRSPACQWHAMESPACQCHIKTAFTISKSNVLIKYGISWNLLLIDVGTSEDSLN